MNMETAAQSVNELKKSDSPQTANHPQSAQHKRIAIHFSQ